MYLLIYIYCYIVKFILSCIYVYMYIYLLTNKEMRVLTKNMYKNRSNSFCLLLSHSTNVPAPAWPEQRTDPPSHTHACMRPAPCMQRTVATQSMVARLRKATDRATTRDRPKEPRPTPALYTLQQQPTPHCAGQGRWSSSAGGLPHKKCVIAARAGAWLAWPSRSS